jgi:hypothetical protein
MRTRAASPSTSSRPSTPERANRWNLVEGFVSFVIDP